MKKIIGTLFLLCCIFVNTIASASMLLEYDGGIHNYTGSIYSLSVNGSTLSNLPLEPIIFNDRALVPLREVFEALGAKVDYNGNDKSIDVTYTNRRVHLKIGSSFASVDDSEVLIPDGVAPKLIAKWGQDAKTMVPVRFISENIGLNVDFDGSRGHISISDGSVQATPTPTQTPTPAPTQAPVISTKTKLTHVTYSENGAVVTVRVEASDPISAITKGSVTSSGVLYTDISGATYSTPNKVDVNLGSVVAVRFGLHDNSARIAVDTTNMKKHNVYLAEDRKTVVLEVTYDENAILTTPPSLAPITPPSNGSSNRPAPNGEKIVIIDAGHGGSDPGTRGSLMNEEELAAYHAALESTDPIIATMTPGSGKTYLEKDVALTVAQKVQANLEQNGVKVLMTRSGDTYPSLDERPELANTSGASLFMSIHLNSTTTAVTAAKGIEIFYSEQNNGEFYGTSSEDLASAVLNDVIAETGARSRGVKTANHLVTRKSLMPAALIELGFMNNPDELSELITDTYQTKLADGIASGIMKVYNRITLQ